MTEEASKTFELDSILESHAALILAKSDEIRQLRQELEEKNQEVDDLKRQLQDQGCQLVLDQLNDRLARAIEEAFQSTKGDFLVCHSDIVHNGCCVNISGDSLPVLMTTHTKVLHMGMTPYLTPDLESLCSEATSEIIKSLKAEITGKDVAHLHFFRLPVILPGLGAINSCSAHRISSRTILGYDARTLSNSLTFQVAFALETTEASSLASAK